MWTAGCGAVITWVLSRLRLSNQGGASALCSMCVGASAQLGIIVRCWALDGKDSLCMPQTFCRGASGYLLKRTQHGVTQSIDMMCACSGLACCPCIGGSLCRHAVCAARLDGQRRCVQLRLTLIGITCCLICIGDGAECPQPGATCVTPWPRGVQVHTCQILCG